MTYIYPKTIVIRHRRENKSKCSLQPIINRGDMHFLNYPNEAYQKFENYFLLSFEGPTLSFRDKHKGLLLLDGTWKYAAKMQKEIFKGQVIERRSLPKEIVTAYPRKQDDCDDPTRGLASIEALFMAYYMLGRNAEGLLDQYYWKDEFLKKNQFFIDANPI